MTEIARLRKTIVATDQVWSRLNDDLKATVAEWSGIDQAAALASVGLSLGAELLTADDHTTLTVRFGQVLLRLNDPIGHISARFTRDTSFGVDTVIVVFKVEPKDYAGYEVFRVDDQQYGPCTQDDILETIRLNLLQPKISPLRVRVAMERADGVRS